MTAQITAEEVHQWITAGGDGAMLKAMEIITHHGNPAVAGNWAASFMADVPIKAKQFRNRMTDKQRDTATKILVRKEIMAQLQVLVPQYFEATNAGDGKATASVISSPPTMAEPELVLNSEKAISPAPDVPREYADDPLWGMF